MKKFLILPLVLCACAKEQPASHVAAQEAIETIGALYESLPSDCKTKTTDFLVTMAQNKAAKCDTECAKEKDQITQEKLKWQWSFWALAVVVGAYFARKVLK